MKRSKAVATILSAFILLSAVSFAVASQVKPAGTKLVMASIETQEVSNVANSSDIKTDAVSEAKETSKENDVNYLESTANKDKKSDSDKNVKENKDSDNDKESNDSSKEETKENAEPSQNEAVDLKTNLPDPEIYAKSVILMEASTGKILYEQNSHEKLPPASITKVMTELLTLEAIDSGKLSWDEKLTCSAHASSMGGSNIWLEPNEQMTVKDLFKAMSISSANDAAVVFAEKIGGSEPGFVSMMNAKAKELGMNDTHFVNANGLDADGHLTSAHDIALMSKELIKHDKIFDYCTVWMDSLRGGKTQLVNTNKMIRTYNGINGLKTGSTNKAGCCVSSTAMRDGMQLIAVTMGAGNSKDRFATATNLLNYGFGGWAIVKPKTTQTEFEVKVQNGCEYSVHAKLDNIPSVLVTKGKETEVTSKVSLPSEVKAPIQKDQVIGNITYMVDGKVVETVPIKAESAVNKLNFGSAFNKLIHFI